MARKSEKVGRGPCPCCGEKVSFHRTAGGMLNYECDACDHSAYAAKGGKQEGLWLASMDQAAPAPTPPAPEPSTEPKTATAPAKTTRTASVFSLGGV